MLSLSNAFILQSVGYFVHAARRVRIAGVTAREDIGMRRVISLAAFGFGFYYLWNNNDPTTDLVALGAMGIAVLLEFAAPD